MQFLDPSDPEHRKILERQHEQAVHLARLFRSDLREFTDNGPVHAVYMMRHIFHILAGDLDNSPRLAAYFEGMFTHALYGRGTCECGEDHTAAELIDMLAPVPDDLAPLEPKSDYEAAAIPQDTDELRDKLREYNVDFIAEYVGDARVYCLRCNMMYPSLEDRMLKAPDHCPRCQQLEGHGGLPPV